MGPLCDVEWLAARRDDKAVRIVDCRWYLSGKRGADAYAGGHIPGAVFVDVEHELAAPAAGGPGRHPLPTPAAFAATLARLGIGPSTWVVAYDDASGVIAARLWWMLGWVGHAARGVLDGGVQAWVAAGQPLSIEVPHIEPAPLMSLHAAPGRTIDKHGVDAMRTDRLAVVIDARASERFDGKIEPVDPRPGHVPGARSFPFAENIGRDGKMLPAAELRDRYHAAGALAAQRIAVYCGSGITACHDLLALTILGRPHALLYEGSWSDWSRDPSLPAAIGPDPHRASHADAAPNSRDSRHQKG